MTEIVLRFGRYTFDGNALPRPQLGDESGQQLIGRCVSLPRYRDRGRRDSNAPLSYDPEQSGTVGKLPKAVVYARQSRPPWRGSCLECTINLVGSRDLRPRRNVQRLARRLQRVSAMVTDMNSARRLLSLRPSRLGMVAGIAFGILALPILRCSRANNRCADQAHSDTCQREPATGNAQRRCREF